MVSRNLTVGTASCKWNRGRDWSNSIGTQYNWNRWRNWSRDNRNRRWDWGRCNWDGCRSVRAGSWPDWLVGDRHAFVSDVCDESRVLVTNGVGHNLGSAVRELDSVFADRRVTIPGLVVTEISAAIVRISLK